jgi:hypothetical protein
MEGQPPDMEKYLLIHSISSCRQMTRGGPSAWGLDVQLMTSHYKNKIALRILKQLPIWTNSLDKYKQWNIDMGHPSIHKS